MKTNLPNDDSELCKVFGIILSKSNFSDYINAIAELIYKNELSKESLLNILAEYKIRRVQDINEELLDLIIVYINLVLDDHIISDNEKQNLSHLKTYFKIKEGDFYNKRYDEIEKVLHRQFERLYADNLISEQEDIYLNHLQDIFDLSYDQLDKFKAKEVKRALDEGANITDLSTAKFPKTKKG
ncbi:MAG TPA: hypothetical protein PLN06_10045 [Bacteroidales bacterium]|nr:hypothetical protein [Bacteroidales bacterium]HOU96941.1 hypothetical protein [Bacteroidales bacterium]